MPRFAHEAREAPERFGVVVDDGNDWREKIAHALAVADFGVEEGVRFEDRDEARGVEHAAGFQMGVVLEASGGGHLRRRLIGDGGLPRRVGYPVGVCSECIQSYYSLPCRVVLSCPAGFFLGFTLIF